MSVPNTFLFRIFTCFLMVAVMADGEAKEVMCDVNNQISQASKSKEIAINNAYEFLYRQMDRYHESIIIYDEPDYAAYYPSGLMGAVKAVDIDIYNGESVCFGSTSFKLSYDFKKDIGNTWAGVYFQYPDNNWGDYPGSSLIGAKELSFYIRAEKPVPIKVKLGGINIFPYHDPSKPHSDSLDSLWMSPESQKPSEKESVLSVSNKWEKIVIDLSQLEDEKLSEVIGPLALIFDRNEEQLENSIYLDRISISMGEDWGERTSPRFIQSYIVENYNREKKKPAANAAHIYDQALALLAFLALPTDENIRRAKYIADALVISQNHDRCFNDGRLRNAYASGELVSRLISFSPKGYSCQIKPPKRAVRIPGAWQPEDSRYEEDVYSVGSDVGNMSWVGIALVQAYEIIKTEDGQRNDDYLEAVKRIVSFVDQYERELINSVTILGDSYGGYSGGRDYQCKTTLVGEVCQFVNSGWRSTEHNIDLYVLFSHLEYLDKENASKWQEKAEHAASFVNQMWNDSGFFHTGVTEHNRLFRKPEAELNKSIVPIDAQTWSALAFKGRILDKTRFPYLVDEKLDIALEWALDHCGDQRRGSENKSIYGYDFDCEVEDGDDADGAWWEGTSQLAAALHFYPDKEREAQLILRNIRNAQLSSPAEAQGAIPATNKDKLTTGITKWWGKWTYPNDPHIGATAWYLFAELGVNPYYLETNNAR